MRRHDRSDATAHSSWLTAYTKYLCYCFVAVNCFPCILIVVIQATHYREEYGNVRHRRNAVLCFFQAERRKIVRQFANQMVQYYRVRMIFHVIRFMLSRPAVCIFGSVLLHSVISHYSNAITTEVKDEVLPSTSVAVPLKLYTGCSTVQPLEY